MKRPAKKPTAEKLPDNVGFRLEPEFNKALAEEAARLQRSRHLLARDLVVDALMAKETVQDTLEAIGKLWEEVRVMRREVEFLRQDLALATESLLHSAGRITPDEASKWAARNLNVNWNPGPGESHR